MISRQRNCRWISRQRNCRWISRQRNCRWSQDKETAGWSQDKLSSEWSRKTRTIFDSLEDKCCLGLASRKMNFRWILGQKSQKNLYVWSKAGLVWQGYWPLRHNQPQHLSKTTTPNLDFDLTPTKGTCQRKKYRNLRVYARTKKLDLDRPKRAFGWPQYKEQMFWTRFYIQ